MTAEAVLERLDVAPGHGLASAAAATRLERDGRNRLPVKPPPGAIEIGVRQLRSPLIYVLLAAAGASLLIGELGDAAFIAIVLAINSAVGGWQEWRAEQQRHGLQKLLQPRATVLRDGQLREVDAADVVQGDVVALESGQRVAADARLLVVQALEIDEALLTGESLPVRKDASWLGPADADPSDCLNMVYAGSTVVRGRGRAVVVATGAATHVGRLAIAITSPDAGNPPLVERMERFSRVIAIAVLLAATLIGTVAVLLHDVSIGTMLMFGIALAVSAIPEGLPVAITIALAVAARRMASRGAIVRRLPAVEGLGSCTLIASDKTGTLTCNELTACEAYLADGRRCRVSGAGYRPDGQIHDDAGKPIDASDLALRELLEVAVACNEGDLHLQHGEWAWRGDPTDVALLTLAAKGRCDRERLLERRPRLDTVPFEPERRYAVSVHAQGGAEWIAVKGAPEAVLAMCRMSAERRESAQSAAVGMASRGQRVLALASGARVAPPGRAMDDGAPKDLGFAGLVGLIDPLRAEARDAVRNCKAAGVRVIMVTGDHPVTALAIARDLGIAEHAGDVIYGPDLRACDPDGLRQVVADRQVFARATPEQKLTIVEAAQRGGHFVAVTGDGVNDAPALRHANIGVAMGRGGTDVARDASDVVLSDDNFATIVAGVEEGRVAYQNIRNVVYLVAAAAFAEVLTVGLAVMVGLPLPLLPTQLLWLNLVTNGIQDVSLAFEGRRGDELRAPPRSPGEPLFDRLMLERVLLGGTWMAVLGFSVYAWLLESGVAVWQARNALMLLMVLLQNVDTFNARSETVSAFRMPLARNPLLVAGVTTALLLHVGALHVPLLQQLLEFAPVTAATWLWMGVAALSLLLVMELHKVSWRHRAVGSPRSASTESSLATAGAADRTRPAAPPSRGSRRPV